MATSTQNVPLGVADAAAFVTLVPEEVGKVFVEEAEFDDDFGAPPPLVVGEDDVEAEFVAVEVEDGEVVDDEAGGWHFGTCVPTAPEISTPLLLLMETVLVLIVDSTIYT